MAENSAAVGVNEERDPLSSDHFVTTDCVGRIQLDFGN
jgi:hypothetical protein